MAQDDFYIEKKVYYHDTDAGGVVYYARYLAMLEEARTELCLKKGFDCAEWLKKGFAFVVVHCAADYRRPARYGDTVSVTARVARIGNSSVEFEQEIVKDDTVLVNARVIWACVGGDFKTRPVPEEIRARLAA